MLKISVALLFTLLALTSTVRAQTQEVKYYDIETIIFESLDPAAKQSEQWQYEVDKQVPPVSVELDQPYPGQLPTDYDPNLTFKTLPPSEFRLNTEEKLLTNSHEYKILLHTAWVQPGMGPDVALPVHITRSFLVNTPVTQNPTPDTPDAPASGIPVMSVPTQTRSVLDGYIKIILTRYLHADVDLTYTTGLPVNPQTSSTASTGATTSPTTMPNTATPSTMPTATPASTVNTTSSTVMAPGSTAADETAPSATATNIPAPVVYQLKQSRRMRSDRLHYLDHPVLGMLILITQHGKK